MDIANAVLATFGREALPGLLDNAFKAGVTITGSEEDRFEILYKDIDGSIEYNRESAECVAIAMVARHELARYIVFACDNYYPVGGMFDIQMSFDDLEMAKTFVGHLRPDSWHIVDKTTFKIVVNN